MTQQNQKIWMTRDRRAFKVEEMSSKHIMNIIQWCHKKSTVLARQLIVERENYKKTFIKKYPKWEEYDFFKQGAIIYAMKINDVMEILHPYSIIYEEANKRGLFYTQFDMEFEHFLEHGESVRIPAKDL